MLVFLIVRSDQEKTKIQPWRPSRLRDSITPEDLKDIVQPVK
jgi:hypothetical protein